MTLWETIKKKFILIIVLIVTIVSSLFLVATQLPVSTGAGSIISEINVNYTASTKTVCKDQICNTVLYSGTQFVFEDEIWKEVSEARSLKGSGFFINYTEIDPDFILTVIDFNLTSIELESKFIGDPNDYPDYCIVKKSNEEFNCQFKNSIKWTDENAVNHNLISYLKHDMKNSSIVANDDKLLYESNPIGKSFKFGGNSTEIILQDANTENIFDMTLLNGTYEASLIKFNISAIPTTSTILNSSVHLYRTVNSLGSGDNTSIYRLDSQDWDIQIGNPIWWNVRDVFTERYNLTTVRRTDSAPYWFIGNIINHTLEEFNIGNSYVSLWFESEQFPFTNITNGADTSLTTLYIGNIAGSQESLHRSKEYATAGERPFLNITYDLNLPIWSDNSSDGTTVSTLVNFSVFWNSTLEGINLSTYIFSWHNGVNWTKTNTSADQETGVQSIISTASGSGPTLEIWDSFEVDFSGNWTDDGIVEAWYRDNLGTTSSNTGPQPQGSAVGADGAYYAYVETSSADCFTDGETALIYMSPSIDFDVYSEEQITWSNSMYGSNMGNLTLQENTSGTYIDLWSTVGDQGSSPVWFENTTDLSALTGVGTLRFLYTCAGGYMGDVAIDAINVTGAGGSPDNETNRTAINYSTLTINPYETIDQLEFIVNVSYYNNSGSIEKGNLNNTLWLEVWNSTDWVDEGDFFVNETGNFSITVITSSILNAWTNASNIDFRISARLMDFNDTTNFDTINWTAVWLKDTSNQYYLNDTTASFNSTNCVVDYSQCWSNVSKTLTSTVGATIKWLVYANDTINVWNQTDIFTFITTTDTTDTCTPEPGSDWVVTDECFFTDEVIEVTNHINLTGSIVLDNGTMNFTGSDQHIYITTPGLIRLANSSGIKNG